MSRTIKAFGREHSMDEHATLFVTVPDGETEAHVFVEGKLLGKRSEIEGVWLSRAMEKAEYANRLRFVSAFIEGKLSLDGAQQTATKVVERSSQAHAVNDPCLKPSETCGIDIERINKEVNAFAARQAARERCFHERIDRIIQSKKWTHENSACTAPQTGIAIRIDNLYFGGGK